MSDHKAGRYRAVRGSVLDGEKWVGEFAEDNELAALIVRLLNEHEAGEGERVDTCPTCGSDNPTLCWCGVNGAGLHEHRDPPNSHPEECCDDPFHELTQNLSKTPDTEGRDEAVSERVTIETWHGAEKENITLWRRSPDHECWAEIVGPASGHPDNEYIEVCALSAEAERDAHKQRADAAEQRHRDYRRENPDYKRAKEAEAKAERLREELERTRADYIGAVDAQVGALMELIEAEGDPLMKATARKRLDDLGSMYHAEGVAEIVRERDTALSELTGLRERVEELETVLRELHQAAGAFSFPPAPNVDDETWKRLNKALPRAYAALNPDTQEGDTDA